MRLMLVPFTKGKYEFCSFLTHWSLQLVGLGGFGYELWLGVGEVRVRGKRVRVRLRVRGWLGFDLPIVGFPQRVGHETNEGKLVQTLSRKVVVGQKGGTVEIAVDVRDHGRSNFFPVRRVGCQHGKPTCVPFIGHKNA